VNYIIASIKKWNIKKFNELKLDGNWYLITSPDEYSKIASINPRYVFFPHWSWLIPPEIYERYKCIIFHMTDLPFGRGGTPLQNLISRGITETMVSAIKCVKDVDAGDIYLKRPMSLHGSAEEIYMCSSDIIFDMIKEIVSVKGEYPTYPQKGEPVLFSRRTKDDCRIPDVGDLNKVYDWIRMNDAESYVPAFLEMGKLKLEFTRANLRDGYIEADVRIKVRE